MKLKITVLLMALLPACFMNAQTQMVVDGPVNIGSSGVLRSKGFVIVNSNAAKGTGVVVNKGILNLPTGLILKSDDVNDALLANYSTVTTTGMASTNVQLHKTFSETRYYYVSFPFPINMSDIKSGASGNPSLAYGTDYYMREYDAATRARTGNSNQWLKVTANSTLEAGKGYLFALDAAVANREVIFPASAITNLFSTADKSLTLPYYSYTGGVTTGQSWGWTFVGGLNTANYNMSQINQSTYSGTIYYFDRISNDYQEVNFTLGDAAVIPPYVPFFTHEASSGKSIIFKGNAISANPVVFNIDGDNVNPLNLRSDNEEKYDIISLYLSSGQNKDRLRIVTGNDFSEEVDYNNDAAKLFAPAESLTPQLWGMKEQDELCISMLPKSEHRQIALGVKTLNADNYTLSMKNYSGYYQSVILYDKENNTQVDLMKEDYSFSSHNINTTDRFVLDLSHMPTSIDDASSNKALIYADHNQLFVKNIQEGDKIQVYDVTGRLLVSATAQDSEFSTILHQQSGTLVVKLTGSINKTAKIIIK